MIACHYCHAGIIDLPLRCGPGRFCSERCVQAYVAAQNRIIRQWEETLETHDGDICSICRRPGQHNHPCE